MQEKECNSMDLLKYRTVFDATLDGLVLLDENREVVDVNKSALEILGYPEEDMVGKKFISFRAPEDIEKCEQTVTEVMGGKRSCCDCSFIDIKGNRIFTDNLLSQIEIDGKNYIVVSFHDISEIKKLEDDLEEEVKRLRKLNEIMIGREERMIELKKELTKIKDECECGK